MDEVAALWVRTGHAPLRVVYDASSVLAARLAQGDPADVFCSTDPSATAALERRGRLVPGTKRTLYGNSLVLAGRGAQAVPGLIGPGFDMARLLGPDGKLAVGDPRFVFGGRIAQQGLTKVGLWDQVQGRLALFGNIRAAVDSIEKGINPAGVVFATDAQSSRSLRIIGAFPAASHDPIRYVFVAVNGGDAPQSRLFISFLDTQPARDIFTEHGFTPP